MKIGILSTTGNLYPWAGSEETWRILADYALVQGHELDLLLPEKVANSAQVTAIRSRGAIVKVRKELTPISRRLALRGLSSRFKKFFNSPHDVIFVSTGGIADCAWIPDLIPEIEKTKTPIVFFIQSNAEGAIHEQDVRDQLTKTYAKASLMIFLSEHNLKLAERQLAYRFPRRTILMNPVRDAVVNPLDWPSSDNGKLLMAEVARLEVADKRQDQLLEALSTDEWKGRNWSLTFFGTGPDKGHIKKLISFYGLEDKVSMGGHVGDFRQIWRNHHLHILPSSREGMPLALIESMFCGRPAVVTRAGGNAELVRDGIEGYVSPGMHPEIIRETLERAWADRERWSQIGSQAFDRVSGLVPRNWAARMLDLLKEATWAMREQ